MNRLTRRRVLSTTATALSVGLAGCGGGGDGEDGGGDSANKIDMTDDLVFDPEEIEIPIGTRVVWENVGSIGHTVTAYEDQIPEEADYFASGGSESESAAQESYPDEGNIVEGETYEHTFETPGDYEYYCIPHEMNGMVGTVRVT